jgi:hypothetical protein
MISKFGFHHFIFALFPVTFLFLDNIHEIPLGDIFIPIIISFLIVVIPWIFLRRFIGGKKSALIVSLLVILLIIFAHVRSVLIHNDIVEIQFIAENVILMPIFFSVGIFGTIYILRKKISSDITSITNVVSIVVISVMIFQGAAFYLENNTSFAEAQKLLNVPILQAGETGQKPDVYFLLLDAYSGDTTLKNDFGYDNSEFYKQLEKRGFFVQRDSFSNYPNTELSMPSIMNMQYLDFITELQGEESRDQSLAQQLWNENKVMQVFHANGYEINSFHGRGQSYPDSVTENFCPHTLDLNPELASQIVIMYLPVSSIRTSILEDAHHEILTCFFDTMINFEKNNENPLYMHMHVRFPHQPLIFDSEGERVMNPLPTNRFDSALKDAYLQQLIFANKKTIEIVDSIQQKNSDAVIIVMSDHGSRFGVDWSNPSEIDYFRALNNLNALYFPGKESHFPMNTSTVNVFRILFNLYFEVDYEILDEKQIWYVPSKPFQHTDVTEIVKSSSLRN